MPTGTVQAVKSNRPWEGNHGPFVDYVLDFKNNESGGVQEVYITKKPTSPAPTVGETFEFEIAKNDQHGIKIKKVQQQGSFNGAGQSSNGGGGQSNDPERQDSIERQVAAKVAGQLLSGTGDLAKFEQFANAVREWIGGKPLAAQVQPAQAAAAATQTGAPADTSEFGGGNSDDDIPF